MAASSRVGDSDNHHLGVVDRLDQLFMSRLFQVNGDYGGTVQNHGSVAFRSIAQNLVFFLAAQNPAQFAGQNCRPHVPLEKFP
jgi:hypothetical protein